MSATDVIPVSGKITDRPRMRRRWFETVQHSLEHADLVFLDPDNGLEPAGYSHGSAKAGKSITLSELRALVRPGRCLIVYHHQTRREGGHHGEIEHGLTVFENVGSRRWTGCVRGRIRHGYSFCCMLTPIFANERNRSGIAGRG